MNAEREDKTIYKVVVNHEEQYSIWPAHRENPLGWNDAGKSGLKDECLAYSRRSGPICGRSACARRWRKWQKEHNEATGYRL
jgi:MbtH protein